MCMSLVSYCMIQTNATQMHDKNGFFRIAVRWRTSFWIQFATDSTVTNECNWIDFDLFDSRAVINVHVWIARWLRLYMYIAPSCTCVLCINECHVSFADAYDCVVSSGGYGENHLPVASVDESLRVLKKGDLNTFIWISNVRLEEKFKS